MSEIGSAASAVVGAAAASGFLPNPSATAATAATTLASLSANPAVNAATRAALELVVSAGVGITAIDKGLLDASIVKALSKTTFTILLPLFLGTSILKTIAKYGLTKSSLALPTLAALQSFLLYWFTVKVVFPCVLSQEQTGTDEARGTAVCASFGNGGVVPLIFCDSLFRKGSGNNDYLSLSTGYVSMFLVGWSPFFWSFGRSVLLGGNGNGSSSNSSSGVELRPKRSSRRATPPASTSTMATRNTKLISFLRTLLPPPVMGVLIGMMVATIPILKRLFMGGVEDTSAPLLGVVFDTAANFGKAASPLSLLVLVSSLALGAGFGSNTNNSNNNAVGDRSGASTTSTTTTKVGIPFWKRWAVVSFSRFIVSPALMVGLLNVFSSPKLQLLFGKNSYSNNSGWIGTWREQPMLWFVCLLESCMPPAQNQVMMLQVDNKMKEAETMATFLFSVYATSMIPLTIVISVALDKFDLI